MAYVKTVWQTGDVITAAKLNNAEDGIEAAAPLIVTETVDDFGVHTLSETAKTIYDALFSGRIVLVMNGSIEQQYASYHYIEAWQLYDGAYSFDIVITDTQREYTAASDDAYPTYSENAG